MNGLKLSAAYFDECGLPLLGPDFQDRLRHIAIGLPSGSQCHEHDDQVSQDHGWGPTFIVWIRHDKFDALRPSVEERLATLPNEFRGYKTLKCTVVDFNQYLQAIVGVAEAPKDPYNWLRIPEDALFEITHRPIFLDESGFAESRFAQFVKYPEDVWRQRLAAALFWFWEWGVKHLKRAEQRADRLAISWYWSRFSEYVAKTLFLLEHAYSPYHKWLFHVATELSSDAAIVIEVIAQANCENEKYLSVAKVWELLLVYLKKHGFKPKQPDTLLAVAYPDLNEILDYARGIRATIKDDRIRKLKAGQEIVLPPTRPILTWAVAE